MRIINSESKKPNAALGRGLRTFTPWNWAPILVAAALLLTAGLWVMAPQVGQAQGATPAQPTGIAATAGVHQAALSWDDPSDSSITRYEYLQAQAAKLTALDGAANDQFGYSVAVDGDTMVAGAYGDDGLKGAAYVLTRQSGTWSQVAKLTAFDGVAYDEFGYSVAVDGDTVVVGAYRDDDNGSRSGAAYVFTKPATGWVTTSTAAKLTALDGATNDEFGYSVAVDGDTVVVGAWWDHAGAIHSGSAYVFTEPTSGGWVTATETAKLTAYDGDVTDYFGISVAVDGDTVVVGAFYEGDNVADYGSAYVFTKPSGGWYDATETAKLTAYDGADDDRFGISVAVDGDTVVVGASEDDDNDEDFGSAYVFTKPSGGWVTATETAKLTSYDGAAFDFFGKAVAVDGDTVVVSAVGDDDNGERSGSAYLFTKPSGGWADATETVELTAYDGGSFDYFGFSVAVDDDTVVVGAPYVNENGSDSGSAYVFELSDWTAIPDSAAGGTNATSYTVTDLTSGIAYTLAVRAVNASGNSAAATVTATPWWPAPTNLVAAPDSGRVVLQWDTGDPEITNYLVRTELAVNSWDIGEKFVTASAGPRTTTDVTSLLTNGTEYSFTVFAAVLRDGCSNYWGPWCIIITSAASSVTETPTVAVPAAPTNLTATPGDGRVAVTWDNPGNITIRKYQYSTDGGTTFNHMNGSGRNTTSFTFKNLTNGTEYTLAIRASNLSGESEAATVTATPSQ